MDMKNTGKSIKMYQKGIENGLIFINLTLINVYRNTSAKPKCIQFEWKAEIIIIINQLTKFKLYPIWNAFRNASIAHIYQE